MGIYGAFIPAPRLFRTFLYAADYAGFIPTKETDTPVIPLSPSAFGDVAVQRHGRRRPPRDRAVAQDAVIDLRIAVGDMSELLTLLREHFGGAVWPVRIQAVDRARQLKLSLSMDAWLAQRLISAIVAQLPAAEIGRVRRPAPASTPMPVPQHFTLHA